MDDQKNRAPSVPSKTISQAQLNPIEPALDAEVSKEVPRVAGSCGGDDSVNVWLSPSK